MALLFFFWLVCTKISVAGSCLTSDVIAQNDRWDPTTRSSQSWFHTFTVLSPRLRPHKAMSPQYWFDLTVCVCVCVCVCVLWSSQYCGVLNVAKTSAIGSWFLPGSGSGVFESCGVYHYLVKWKYLAIFFQRPRNTCMKPLVFSLC